MGRGTSSAVAAIGMEHTMKTTTKKTTKGQPVRNAAQKAKADVIVTSTGMVGGDKHLVKSGDGREIIIPTARWAGETRSLSAVGASFSAFEKHWASANVAKLARGVDARSAPNSAKAVADNAAKAKPAKVTAKAKATERKAAKSAAKATASKDRAYTANPKALADKPVREGTWTDVMVKTIMAHKSTAAAQAAMDAAKGEYKGRKLDFKWASDVRGYITFK